MNASELIIPPAGAELVGLGIWPQPGIAIARRADKNFVVSADGIRWEALALVDDCDDMTVTVLCPHAPAGQPHVHIHTRSNGAYEDLGHREGHDGCPDYSIGDLHQLQKRYDNGQRWAACVLPIGKSAPPKPPKGYSAHGGRPHGYPLAKHRRTGALLGLANGRWLPVARVIGASGYQVTVKCPNVGCPTGRHFHGRAGVTGEGHRGAHCPDGVGRDYIVLDLDGHAARVPLSREQRHP